MSEIRKLICINCPLGCSIKVEMDGNIILSIMGNTCNKGELYARNEVTNPVRVVTSSVKVSGGSQAVVSVKTKEAIPKDKIFEVVDVLRNVSLKAPVAIGDIVISNVAGTGVDLVVTANVNNK